MTSLFPEVMPFFFKKYLHSVENQAFIFILGSEVLVLSQCKVNGLKNVVKMPCDLKGKGQSWCYELSVAKIESIEALNVSHVLMNWIQILNHRGQTRWLRAIKLVYHLAIEASIFTSDTSEFYSV